VLGRGYGFVTKEDQIVKTAGDLQTGDRIQVRLHQGEADCLVEAVRRRQNR
jgi:exonuclease VII large subunit